MNDDALNKLVTRLLAGDQRYMQDAADALLAMRFERNVTDKANSELNAMNLKLNNKLAKLEKSHGKPVAQTGGPVSDSVSEGNGEG